MEGLFLRDVVQPALGLLHRADGAQDVGIGLVGIVLLKGIVPGLKGHVIGVIAHQNQVIALHNHGVDDLLIEAQAKLVVLQLAGAQIHQQLVLGRRSHLTGFEGDVNEIPPDGTREGSAQKGKILIPLVFRHDARGLPEFGNDFLIVVDITTVNSGHIAAIPAQMATDLADFLINHGYSSFR